MLEVEVQLVKAHETVWIGTDIKFEVSDDLRGDPSGTKLGSRKAHAIQNHQIDAGLTELPGTGRARRTASNYDYVYILHELLAPGGCHRIKK